MKILFLCTGNSCRSQMAEGFVRQWAKAGIEIASAGIEAHGLNPRAVEAMAEIGIDISGQISNVLDPGMIDDGDLVVTVCEHARESCPTPSGAVRQIHWSFDDPAKVAGSDEEIRSVFRRVRDEIGREVKTLVDILPRQWP